MKIKLEKVNCDFCGSEEYEFFTEQKDLIHKIDDTVYKVVNCKKCGLKFTNPRPSEDTISKFYSTKYSFHSKKSIFNLFVKKILEKLANYYFIKKISWIFPKKINQILIKFLKPKINDPVIKYINANNRRLKNINFLDIGCGSGLSTNFWGSKSSVIALSKKINVFGVEPSASARKILDAHRINSFKDIEALDPNEKFDILRLNWSLEHVHYPSHYFQFIENHLSDEGIAVICVPNMDGVLYKINPSALELPVHLFHFDSRSLKNYVEKFNLKVYKFITFSYAEMYLFAEKNSLIDHKYNLNNLNLANAKTFMDFHAIFDDSGSGNDILMVLKK